MRATTPRNHWWHVPLYVTTRGLTTSPIRFAGGTFAIDFDFVDHRLIVSTSDGALESFSLAGLSVADFYARIVATLAGVGITVAIVAKPFDLTPAEPFMNDTAHAQYDAEYVHHWWRILAQVDRVFDEFGGRFTGKTSPVHFFWHSFDLTVTRFSGRLAPQRADADPVTREAYSHEVISFGFWAGDDRVRAPAFYSYTAPEPPGITAQPLLPAPAYWATTNGAMAMLMYDDLRQMESPETALLAFLESAYQAGATTAGWDAVRARVEAMPVR